ncbi:hypothetical protein D3C80_1433940 [compost metagenome]
MFIRLVESLTSFDKAVIQRNYKSFHLVDDFQCQLITNEQSSQVIGAFIENAIEQSIRVVHGILGAVTMQIPIVLELHELDFVVLIKL